MSETGRKVKGLMFVAWLAAVLGFSTLANAKLVDNGGGLIWDSDLNITWYDYTYRGPAGFPGWGYTWFYAVSWASTLTVGGESGWRLPTSDTCNDWNCAGSEMGHLFYTELRNKGFTAPDGTYPQPGWGLVNKGPFTDLNPYWYWSGTESALDSLNAWVFMFDAGGQNGSFNKYDEFCALAVHSGDIGPNGPISTPEPTTMLLLSSGLLGLARLRRKVGT